MEIPVRDIVGLKDYRLNGKDCGRRIIVVGILSGVETYNRIEVKKDCGVLRVREKDRFRKEDGLRRMAE